MGQAQRRKQLGLYPTIKQQKPTVKFDPMDDMSEISIFHVMLCGLMSRRKYIPHSLREDDFE